MLRTAFLTLVAIAAGACSAANANPYDSGDPVQCMAIFGATSGTVRTGPLADELNARIVYIVRSNGGAEWLRRVTPQSTQVAATWEASHDPDRIMKLFDDCRSRQDSDPVFKAALPELMREGRNISATAR